MKDYAIFHVTKVMINNTKKQKAKGVHKEQYVTIGYKDSDNQVQRLKLRRITYKAEDGKIYIYLINNFILPCDQVALIYKTAG